MHPEAGEPPATLGFSAEGGVGGMGEVGCGVWNHELHLTEWPRSGTAGAECKFFMCDRARYSFRTDSACQLSGRAGHEVHLSSWRHLRSVRRPLPASTRKCTCLLTACGPGHLAAGPAAAPRGREGGREWRSPLLGTWRPCVASLLGHSWRDSVSEPRKLPARTHRPTDRDGEWPCPRKGPRPAG